MRILAFVSLVVMVWLPLSAKAQQQFLREDSPQQTVAAPTPMPSDPNGPFGDEYGHGIWNVRVGNVFRATYVIKDRNQGNPMWIEKLVLYAVNDNGMEFAYAQGTWGSCSTVINSDFTAFHVNVDLSLPAFDGYTVGERIHFRWYLKYRDAFCANLVEKHQHFQTIRGESLPMFSGQQTVSLHTHTFWTNDPLESAGSAVTLPPAARALGMVVVVITDHGYDVNTQDCASMQVFADTSSTAGLYLFDGCEGNADNNFTNNFPDNVVHFGTNHCFFTPSEIYGGTQLYYIPQVIQTIESQPGKYFWPAHPLAPPFLPTNETIVQWTDTLLTLAFASERCVGLQYWNGQRTSTQIPVSNTDVINPYPWVDDPSALDQLFLDQRRVDSMRQAHLRPLRRINGLSSTDHHADFAYQYHWTQSSSDPVIDNNAFGKCFTVVELATVSEDALFTTLAAGRCYMSNGPGCRFGVDKDNDGDLDSSFGSQNYWLEGGTIRLFGQSNGEFGQFTKAVFHWFTETTHDSLVITGLSGLNIERTLPVAAIGTEPTFVWAELHTAGGYGDYDGLVLTNPIYFNASTVTGVTTPKQLHQPQLRIHPNPTDRQINVGWDDVDVPERLEIYDVTGRCVFDGQVHHDATSIDYDSSSLANGVYFVRVRFRSDGTVLTKKFTVVR